jgi:hypothetical protein
MSYSLNTDGTVTSDTSARGLARNISKAKAGTIKAVVIRGHGGTHGTTLTGSEGPNGSDSLDVAWGNNGPKLMLTGQQRQGKFKVDFTQLMQGKLSKGADGIFINSCNVGNWDSKDPNLTQVISAKFPGVAVRGVNGTLNESKANFSETYYDSPAWGSSWVNLQDGVPFDPGFPGDNSPRQNYTVFPNES